MTAAPPSLAKLKPNSNWARLPLFNRKGWSRVRFGEVVENVNERVEPADAAEEIYVGLDDLDSGSLQSLVRGSFAARLPPRGQSWGDVWPL